MKVLNSAVITEERKLASSNITSALAFKGSKTLNLKSTDSQKLAVRFNVEKNIDELEILRHRIVKNAESAPAAADLEAFFGRFFIDITRRSLESPDLTPYIANETTNLDFPELIYLRDLLKYRGKMGTVKGENDAVSLIEANTGETRTISLAIKAIGWKDSLRNMLFNRFFDMSKVVQAAVDADTDERNAAIIGVLSALTTANSFDSSQKMGAVSTSGLSLDEKMYETILGGIKKLRLLKDPQTHRPIAVPSIKWLGNSANTWSIENVLRGQLNGNGSGVRASNRPALPISEILEYDRGINDGFTVGMKTLSYPGVTAGKGYLFVPGIAQVANKRPLTMETGVGSVLELSTEERAWYRVQGTDLVDLLGSTSPGTTLGTGYGFIVEVTLPS